MKEGPIELINLHIHGPFGSPMIWRDEPHYYPDHYVINIPKNEFEKYGDNFDKLITKMYKNENYIFNENFFKENETTLKKFTFLGPECYVCDKIKCNCNAVHLQMSFKNAPCFISLRCDLLHQFYPQKIICKCDTTIKDLMDLIENKFTLLPGYFMNNNILLDSDVIVINLKKLNAPINLMYVPIYNNNNFIVNIN